MSEEADQSLSVTLPTKRTSWQWLRVLSPLALIALAFGVLAWHWAGRTAASVRALQITMLLFVVSSGAGAP